LRRFLRNSHSINCYWVFLYWILPKREEKYRRQDQT
jgi:hypothetical protein